ncbi:ABC transporter permease [Spirochaetia bacterium]|nr:ABC transporter permease [Spirochaetia bacterium]
MKKYLEFARIQFRVQIVYRFDVIMTALAAVSRILFAWILWGAVFAGRERVGGFTFPSMLSYYVVSSFITSMEMSEGISGEVSSRIRNGTFSRFMVIPANVQGYFLFTELGAGAYYGIFSLIAVTVSTLIFKVELTLTADPAQWFCATVMILLGLIFMTGYHYFIGLLTFKFQDVGFFLHVQGNLIAFFTGTLIPLSLFPDAVVGILRFLPFYYVTYMPAMLLTGNSGAAPPGAMSADGVQALIILGLWTAGMLLISQITYQRLRVRYDGVGI